MEHMRQIIVGQLNDDINFNVINVLINNLERPLNIVEPERRIPTRNELYFENTIPHYTPDDFHHHFRMTRASFQILLETLQVHNGHHIIPFEKKLLFGIWMLSKPESFLSAGDRFNISKSTSHNIFFEVVQMISNLRNELIRWPNENERLRTSHILQARSGIPGIVGAIDGCHIPIKAPPNNPIDYYNRNNYHSIVLQAVCNERLEFIDVFIGTPGRVHDARVFRISPLYERLIGNELLSHNEHLLGDAAYPLHTFLLKPYRDNGHLRERESRFNTRMSSVRSLIEQTFGLLKGKFRRLKFLDMARIDMTPVVIMAACVLHNFILKNDGIAQHENYNIDIENNMLDIEIEDGHFNRDIAAQTKRDYIAAILH